jgi:dienelactone hydrolase
MSRSSAATSAHLGFRAAGAPASRILALSVVLILLRPIAPISVTAGEAACSEVALERFDQSNHRHVELCIPAANGPFPAVVDLRPRICEGPVGIPPSWEQSTLPAWGYAVLVIDSFAMRGLAPGACDDLNSVTTRQMVGDAYAGLEFLTRDPRIDRNRVALLGFVSGVATATLLADTAEAREVFAPKDAALFRAFFAFSPYCNLEFTGAPPELYAPARIFVGEKDDLEPATRCVDLVGFLKATGADLQVAIYPDAEAGFDTIPPDTNYPLADRTALHPGGTTISTHPQYSPWTHNFADCTIRLKSIFDIVDAGEVVGCARRGAHAQGNAEMADMARNDLKAQLKILVGERTCVAPPGRSRGIR